MRSLKCVLIVFLVVILGCSGPKIIPRGELSQIYAEMLILDQWIQSNFEVRQAADTSFVYGEILESRGYTREDYIATVTRYMRDPNKFAKVIDKSKEIIQEEIDITDKYLKMEKYKVIKEFPELKDVFFYIAQEPYMHFYDSLGRDTIQLFYLKPTYTVSDTIWDGISFILRDSLDVKDSVEIKDNDKTDDKGIGVKGVLEEKRLLKPATKLSAPQKIILEDDKEKGSKLKMTPLEVKDITLSTDSVRNLIKGVKR